MNPLLLKRISLEFLRTLRRNWLMSLATIISMALVFFLTWIIFGINQSSQEIIDRVEKKIDIAVFFEKDIPDFHIESFLRKLESQQKAGEIKSFTYYSKENALEEMKVRFPHLVRFLQGYDLPNPLQSSVEIVPGNNSPDAILQFLQNGSFAHIIDTSFLAKYEAKKDQVTRILQVLSFVRTGGFFLVLIFISIALLLLGFFISSVLQQKKQEIFIMRLVGASHVFIRTPFLLEGVFLAVFALLLSFFLFLSFLSIIEPYILRFFTPSSEHLIHQAQALADTQYMQELLLVIRSYLYANFWWMMGGVVLIAFLISWGTVEKFIRKRHLLEEGV